MYIFVFYVKTALAHKKANTINMLCILLFETFSRTRDKNSRIMLIILDFYYIIFIIHD